MDDLRVASEVESTAPARTAPARPAPARRAPALRSIPPWSAVAALASLLFVPTAIGNLRLPYWYDEAFTVRAAENSWTGLLRVLGADGGNMLGHTMALKVVRAVTDERTVLRVLTLIAAVAAVVLLHRLVRRAASERAAALAAVALATNTVFVHYSTEVRSYGFIPLSLVLVAGSTAKLVDGTRRADWLRLGLLAGVASNLHHTATFGVVAILAAALMTAAGRARWRRLGLATATWVLCAAPAWWMAARDDADQVSWIPPLSVGRIATMLQQIGGASKHLAAWTWGLALVGVALTVVSLVGHRSHGGDHGSGRVNRPIEATLLAGWLVGMPVLMAVASVRQSLMVPRYFIGVVPALAAMTAIALDWCLRRTVAHGAVAIALLVGMAALALPLGQGERDERWDVVLDRLAADAEPRDGIAFSPHQMRLPFELNGRDHPEDFARVRRAAAVGSTVPWGAFDYYMGYAPLDDAGSPASSACGWCARTGRPRTKRSAPTCCATTAWRRRRRRAS